MGGGDFSKTTTACVRRSIAACVQRPPWRDAATYLSPAGAGLGNEMGSGIGRGRTGREREKAPQVTGEGAATGSGWQAWPAGSSVACAHLIVEIFLHQDVHRDLVLPPLAAQALVLMQPGGSDGARQAAPGTRHSAALGRMAASRCEIRPRSYGRGQPRTP